MIYSSHMKYILKEGRESNMWFFFSSALMWSDTGQVHGVIHCPTEWSGAEMYLIWLVEIHYKKKKTLQSEWSCQSACLSQMRGEVTDTLK